MSSSYSFYDASITTAHDLLDTMTAILKKGESSPNASSLPEARIHPDMLPLTFQVHVLCDLSQKMAARLTGQEPLQLEKDLATFKDMYARIDKIKEVLSKVDKNKVNEFAGKNVPVGMGPGNNFEVKGWEYVQGYALPNLYFHVTTAYCILRKEGVPLSKFHYLKPSLAKYVPGFQFPE